MFTATVFVSTTVKSCVRVNGTLSEFFDSYMGVKQGEPLSTLLYIFFVNDMSSYLQTDSLDYSCTKVHLLGCNSYL